MAALPSTRKSLFDRLAHAPVDPRAWNEFVATFGPPVARWCRRHGLEEAFRMLAIERRSGQQVAEALGMSVANASMARMNVQRMISNTLRRPDIVSKVG